MLGRVRMNVLAACVCMVTVCMAAGPPPAVADTHMYEWPCYAYSDEHGGLYYSIGDDHQALHYEHFDSYGQGLDWGWTTEGDRGGAYWFQATPGAPSRGVDQGEPATFYTMVMANPFDPEASATILVMAVQDPAIRAPPRARESGRKR